MSAAYFDQTFDKEAATAYLNKLKAKRKANKSTSTRFVYGVGSGEALVEKMPNERYRIRLYAGGCPCDGG